MLPTEVLAAVEGALAGSAETTSTKTPSLVRAWYALIIFELVCCLTTVDSGVTTMMVRPLETAFNLNDFGLAAVTLTPIAIGSGLVSYPGGLLGDAYRRISVIAWAVILWTVATGLVIVVHTPLQLFIVRFIAGVGVYGGIPAMASAISDLFPAAQRGYAFGAWNVGLAVGSGASISLTAMLVALAERIGAVHVGTWSFAPWQVSFAMVTMLSLIAGLLCFTVTEPERRDVLDVGGTSTRESAVAFGGFLRRHGLLWGLYTIASSAVGLGALAAAAWAPTLAIRAFGALGPGPMNLVGACTTASMLIASVSMGMFCQYLATTKRARILPFVLAGLSLATGVFSTIYPFAPTWLLAAIGLGAAAGVRTGFNVFGYLVVTESVPNRVRGQLWGVMSLFAFIPGTIIPTLTAYLADETFAHRGGFVPALALIGAIGCVIAIALFMLCVRPYARAVDDLRGADYGREPITAAN